jgi:cation diffusion facilitator family transporter
VLGIGLVQLTGWLVLDPIVALLVAANIVWTGINLLRETGLGLLDTAIPEADQRTIAHIMAAYQPQGIQYHALRSRVSGAQSFINFHVLVPGLWTVQRGHDVCQAIEQAIEQALPGSDVIIHLEPLEDPKSWDAEQVLS